MTRFSELFSRVLTTTGSVTILEAVVARRDYSHKELSEPPVSLRVAPWLAG